MKVEGRTMNKIMTSMSLIAILGLPIGPLGVSAGEARMLSSAKPKIDKDVKEKKAKKSLPAPPTLLLLGVAGGVALAARRLQRNRR
jgi:hypothetical protein